jgi:hypothetical protein
MQTPTISHHPDTLPPIHPHQQYPHPHQHPPQHAAAQFSKTKLRGIVRFPPYENFDDTAVLGEVRRFRVRPFGAIRSTCAHIPYNSGKKDFFEKTGRESFEGEYFFLERVGNRLEDLGGARVCPSWRSV